MAMTQFELSGRITRKDTGDGVFGIRVEAWAPEQADGPLAVAITNRDGVYQIDLRSGAHGQACCECKDVYIKLRDRDCRLIYDGCADRRCCKPGEARRVDVALEPQALWWHLSRPLAWEAIPGPLIPERVLHEIEDALEVLRADAVQGSTASMDLALCVTPPIEGFERVLQDAWSALQGDQSAAQRYRDVLDALCSGGACECTEHASFTDELAALFETSCDAASLECKEPESCTDCCDDCGKDGNLCSCGSSLVSDDKAVLLAMAALHVACGDRSTSLRYLRTLLDQLCRFGTLAALHSASLQTLLGDAAAKTHARDLFELLCIECGSAQRGGKCVLRRTKCCNPCIDKKLLCCLRDAVKEWCRIDCYRICEVRPSRACAGDEILIVGCDFGDQPGRVRFRSVDQPASGPSIEPSSWCDERITVTVPKSAGCGLWLEMPPTTIRVCDRFLQVRPIGCIEQGFEGTSPQILRFNVKDYTPGECPLQPGEPLRIRWNTCAADRVRVELIDTENGSVIAAQDPAALNGRWDFTATNFNRTVRMRVRITAFGRCTPPQISRQIDLVFQKRPNLQVQGLEVTQSIQYYRAAQHLTDPADRGPDNSLRLVTNKTAWVRTYLRSGQDPSFDNGQLADVSGTLRVERRVNGVWGVIATLPSQNGPVIVEDTFASYDAERGNINATLNFVVPANLMNGLLRFTADVASPFAPCPGNVASGSTQVDVNLQQTLNAAFITIGYNGPNATNTGNIVLAAPTLAQCQTETSWAMTTYPVSGAANTRLAGTFVTATPLNDPRSCPGCCSPNWQPLLQQVAALVALDQASNPGQWVYYGIVAGGIPVNVPGCAGWGATGGLAGAPLTYAHEIGHQFGLPHARCGNAGNGNPNYTIYEPYDLPVDPAGTTNWTMASIGEYGLDINNGAIANPNSAEDFMSYCAPRWMSVFTYNFLTNIAQLTPQTIPSGSGSGAPRLIEDTFVRFDRDEDAVAPMIHMLGVIDADEVVSVTSVARIQTKYMRGRARQTGFIAQHLDADGRVIAQDVVYGYESEGCAGGAEHGDCGCKDCSDKPSQPVLFKAMLPDLAPGAVLRIVKGKKVVWERRGASELPAIRNVRAEINKKGDVEISWKIAGDSRHATKKAKNQDVAMDVESREPVRNIEVWARWTNDDGKTWHALTVGQNGESMMIPAEQCPSGTVRFELLANDGFHTTRAITDAITLAPKPPSVAILYPTSSARVYADKLLHLWGIASNIDGSPLDVSSATWFIDDKPVGTGLDIWVENCEPSRHRVQLQVGSGDLVGSATTEFEVIGSK